MNKRPKFERIDDYIASVPPESRLILEEIRKLIRTLIPEAEEAIGYQMPAFRLGRLFIYFAAFKNHIGIYPPVKGDRTLANALLPYRGDKGNLKFPLSQPMPYEIIGRVAVALSREVLNNSDCCN
jgi:uncharacterized protein YdhG (YjbR/CyaY superfamily)